MDREKAIKVLGVPDIEGDRYAKWNADPNTGEGLIIFHSGSGCMIVDGMFTSEHFDALAWWMREYGK